jgi:hypothetical protein
MVSADLFAEARRTPSIEEPHLPHDKSFSHAAGNPRRQPPPRRDRKPADGAGDPADLD